MMKTARQPRLFASTPPKPTPSTEPNSPAAMKDPITVAWSRGGNMLVRMAPPALPYPASARPTSARATNRNTKFPAKPQAMVAIAQHSAIRAALFTRPQRSARKDIGSVKTPTVSETTLTSEPSWVSVSSHSDFRSGKIAVITWRDR